MSEETMEISKIPTKELISDLAETCADLEICRQAKECGVETYGDGESVAERFQTNLKIKMLIEMELYRRVGAN